MRYVKNRKSSIPPLLSLSELNLRNRKILYIHIALVSVKICAFFKQFFANVVTFLLRFYDRSRFGVHRKQ
nr:MAG TPA: hypothetical protein [Caudoviricetes sp.]